MVGVVGKADHQGTGAAEISEGQDFRVWRGYPGISQRII